MSNPDLLAELRAWRDEFARSHGYDIHAMATALRDLDSVGGRQVIHGEPRRPVATGKGVNALPLPGVPEVPLHEPHGTVSTS